MNIRTPQSGKAAKLAKAYLQSQGLAASHQQCLELVARLHGYQSWHEMEADPKFQDKPALKPASSTEYTLDPAADGVWVEVKNISVHIRRNDEGVSVDLFALGREDAETLVGTWLTYDEAQADTDERSSTSWLQYDKPRDMWYWSARPVATLSESGRIAPRFEGRRDVDWAGPFADHEDAVAALVKARGDATEVNWVRSDAPHEAQCAVFQDNGDYQSGLSLPNALQAARDLRDAGANGTWTVETLDGELIAVYR
jgi:hypothetical protein